MVLTGITYTGAPVRIDDPLFDELDEGHRAFLEVTNGLVAFHGGLHIRGICDEPTWHSLEWAWRGPEAFHRFYPELTPDDVPFAQDAFGDQYLLRDGFVVRLSAEDAALTELGLRFREFIDAASEDPMEFLALGLLEEFRRNGELAPGQLLKIHPPACSEEALNGVVVTAVPARDRFVALVNLAHAIRSLPPFEE